jgi:hypothetical protein
MRFGYWAPVFGGWLRNVPDEGMNPSWESFEQWLSAPSSSAR